MRGVKKQFENLSPNRQADSQGRVRRRRQQTSRTRRLGRLPGASHLNLKSEKKEELLEMLDAEGRLEESLQSDAARIEILQVERRIRSRVASRRKTSHKEITSTN
jgi:ATP-dependent Lon protease